MKARRSRWRASGFSLVELMISMSLGVVIIGAVGAVFLSSKQSYSTSESLSRAQESARFAMQFVVRELRLAGYSPRFEQGIDDEAEIFVSGGGLAAGQLMSGTNNSSGVSTILNGSDVVIVRYQGNGNGSMFDCQGVVVAAGVILTTTMFVSPAGELTCTTQRNGGGATTTALVDGITGMQVTYGVDTDVDVDLYANSYVASNAVTDWSRVASIKVELTVSGNDAAVAARPITSVVAIRNQLP